MATIARPNSATNPWQPDPGGYPTIIERYQILGIIGQGGMGTVFKGFHVNLKRFVAIKTMRIGTSHGPELLDRFRREMEVIGQMDHPNVVRATDAGEKNGVFYLVMEHLTGLDLGKLVAQQGALAVADACELTRQAALGLNYIHQTLVHRDIKPSNLMLTTTGLVKVLDLGLARPGVGQAPEGELTPRGCALGTFAYIAPEQATASSQIDGRADIYSLGCTLYKLLTNQTPFSGPEYNNPAQQIHAHCNVPLTSVSGFSSIPEGLRSVLLRMMAKDPAHRFSTGQEVADALAPFTAGSQNLQALVDTAGGAALTPLQPLRAPFPEEISRLTVTIGETSAKSSLLEETIDVRQPPRSRKRVGLLVGIGGLFVGLAALGSFFVPDLHAPRDPEPKKAADPVTNQDVHTSGPRLLDNFPLRKYQVLLDEPPQQIGTRAAAGTWHWDKGMQTVKVEGPQLLLLQLGTTTRKCFTLDTGITQHPWAGNVGLFWGYRENTAAKEGRVPSQEFAWFQIIIIHKTVDYAKYSVRRASVILRHNDLGQVVTETQYKAKEDLPELPEGEKILEIVVDHNNLRRAYLGRSELLELSSEAVNSKFKLEPGQGNLGLVSFGFHATFSKARFIATPSD